jgi:hypothetical protein
MLETCVWSCKQIARIGAIDGYTTASTVTMEWWLHPDVTVLFKKDEVYKMLAALNQVIEYHSDICFLQ